MKGAVKTLFFLSMFITTSAQASIVMCTDASGRTFTSDRPIPECANRPVREYSKSGNIKKEIAAPLTAEQKQMLELQQQKKKAEQAAANERKRADRALYARYRSEDDIASARQRDTELVHEQMAQQQRTLADVEKEWHATQAAVAAHAIPAGLHEKLERSEKNVRELKKSVQDSVLELAQINEKYDLILQRYREIAQTASSR